MDQPIRDNAAKNRFELVEDGHTVIADYRREPGVLIIFYVAAPPDLRGTGAAGRLIPANLMADPCPFASAD